MTAPGREAVRVRRVAVNVLHPNVKTRVGSHDSTLWQAGARCGTAHTAEVLAHYQQSHALRANKTEVPGGPVHGDAEPG